VFQFLVGFNAFIEIVGHRTHKHILCKVADFGCRNQGEEVYQVNRIQIVRESFGGHGIERQYDKSGNYIRLTSSLGAV
jgi:hypothetical protein